MLNFIRGFCMALADSVPGVSGGTVAFLLGFYDKFIMSLDHLMSGTKEENIYNEFEKLLTDKDRHWMGRWNGSSSFCSGKYF